MAFIDGTSAPVRRVVFEPGRKDNPFLPSLPPPKEAPALPEPIPLPEWLTFPIREPAEVAR